MSDASLDGSRIIERWFPQAKFDVFLSHSHQDFDEVLALAGWLLSRFGIESFIDSSIWGYGKDLIQLLDNEHSLIDESKKLYSYNGVINSATHVNMMLATALNVMIDKTECLVFYNTPNAIESFDGREKTSSPWVYSEILFSRTIRMNVPTRIQILLEESRMMSEKVDHFEKAAKIRYDIDAKHLHFLTSQTLNSWESFSSTYQNSEEAMDGLYELTFPLRTNRRRIS